MTLIWWFVLLVCQNAAFTWVSRARNSGSYSYHAIAAVFSNGLWFASQFVMLGIVLKPGLTSIQIVTYAVTYIAATVSGSVLMHWVSVNYLEKGRRKVGA